MVFIESNTSGTGRKFADIARTSGFVPVMLTADPSRYSYLVQDKIQVVRAATSDLTSVLVCCESLEASFSIAGISSSSEYYIATSAAAAAAMGLPGPNPNAILECRDKSRQCTILAHESVPVPAFHAATTVAEAIDFATAIDYPVVVKPLTGSGSVGVRLCRNHADVQEFAGQLFQSFVNEPGAASAPCVLVERYVEGIGYSVETMGTEVIGITRKHPGMHCSFVATGHDFPGAIDRTAAAELENVTMSGLRALRLLWGPAHTELCYTTEGAVIIEVNPRLAGAMIPELIRLATGRDLIQETIALSTNTGIDRQSALNRYSAIRFLVPPKEGKLISVMGFDSAKKVTNVVSVALYATIGTTLRLHEDFRDKIGHVIAVADDRDVAGLAAEESLSHIAVSIAP